MRLKLLFLATVGLIFSFSCKKDANNPAFDLSSIAVGSYISITETVNLNLDFAEPTSVVSIKVKSVGSPVDKIDMFVVEGANTDATTWKFIKTVAYAGEGTELAATNAEIKAALGEDIKPGAQYTIYDRVKTVDGRTFDMTNISDNESAADYFMALRWTINAVAPFTGNMSGDYLVVEDGWDQLGGALVAGGVVDGPGANQITVTIYPNPDYGAIVYDPIIVDIEQATGVATVSPVHYADYGGGYDMTCSGGGFVFSATGTVDLTLNHYIGDPETGSLGNYRLVAVKQ